jgi:hypothetical protein
MDFTINLLVDKTPEEAFNAINNVRGWWSDGVEYFDDEFVYWHKDIHYSRQKLAEVIPGKRVVWLVTDSSLNFLNKKDEWTGTKVIFDISKKGDKTNILFTHEGLVPEVECFDACTKGWTYYVKGSLFNLITTGKGEPDQVMNTAQVAARFHELAQQEKWFEIQDELFADDVKSIEPPTARYLPNAEGKTAVRKKGEEWVKRVEAVHGDRHTTAPVVGGNYFAVGRNSEITVKGIGRLKISEVMMYEVRNGKIVSERFFY